MSRKGKGRNIIDIETLEVFPTLLEAAKACGCTVQNVIRTITLGKRCHDNGHKYVSEYGRRLEYLDYWQDAYTSEEKERWTRQNNIFFM